MAVKFDATLNWNVVITAGMILLAAVGLYYSLDKSVAVLGTAIDGKFSTLTAQTAGQIAEIRSGIVAAVSRVDGQISTVTARLDGLGADRGRLEANLSQLNNLVLQRSESRYNKDDARRDAEVVTKRFDEIAHRLDTFELINRDQDAKLEELRNVINRIAETIAKARAPPVAD